MFFFAIAIFRALSLAAGSRELLTNVLFFLVAFTRQPLLVLSHEMLFISVMWMSRPVSVCSRRNKTFVGKSSDEKVRRHSVDKRSLGLSFTARFVVSWMAHVLHRRCSFLYVHMSGLNSFLVRRAPQPAQRNV